MATVGTYTKIDNQLLSALTRSPLSKRQLRVLLAIVRQTCGYHRVETELSGGRLAELTGLHRQHCNQALIELEALGVIQRHQGTNGQTLSIEMNFSCWCVIKADMDRHQNSVTDLDGSAKQRHQNGVSTDTETVSPRHQNSVSTDTVLVHIKEKKEKFKENLKQKRKGNTAYESIEPVSSACKQSRLEDRFDAWWQCYPRKRSKGQARKAWKRIKPDDALTQAMIDAVAVASKTVDWQKDGGRYVPYPATWLDAEGWKDEHHTESGQAAGHAVTSTVANLADLFGEPHGATEFSAIDDLPSGSLQHGSQQGSRSGVLAPTGCATGQTL